MNRFLRIYESKNENIFNKENLNKNSSYLLGWLASNSGDINLKTSSVTYFYFKREIRKFETMMMEFTSLPHINLIKNSLYCIIESSKIAQDAFAILFNNEEKLQFPQLEDDELQWCFIKGYIEGSNIASSNKHSIELTTFITNNTDHFEIINSLKSKCCQDFLIDMATFTNFEYVIIDDKITFIETVGLLKKLLTIKIEF